MPSNRVKITIILIVLALVASTTTIYFSSQTSARELKVATLRGACGISFTEVLDALDLDRKAGLDVAMVPLDGVPIEVDALIRGEVDVAIVPVDFLPQYVSKGAALRILLLDMTQYQALVSKSGVTTLSDLNAKRIGVFKPTSTYLTLKAYLLEMGFKVTEGTPSSGQVALINVPIPAMPETLQKGEVDVIATIGPSTILSIEGGGSVLAAFNDLSKNLGLSGPPPLIVFVTTVTKLKEKASEINALLKSRGEALQEWLKQDSVVDKLYVEKCGLKKDLAIKYHSWLMRYVWKGEPLGEDVKKGIEEHISLLEKHDVIDSGGLGVEEVVGRLLGR
jgi:ABC-type nitrate/sulfonate/bicarbonate transport system substrate-binding protein